MSLLAQKCGIIATQGGASFDPAAEALFARMTTPPTEGRKAVINNLIVALKTDGIWDDLDTLWVMAAETQQAATLNWKSTSFTLTEVSSIAWTADEGYTGDGSADYLETNYVPSTDGVAWASATDASMGIYIRTNVQEAGFDMGVLDGNNTASIIGRFNTNNRLIAKINRVNPGGGAGSVNSDSRGFLTVERNNSSGEEAFWNGVTNGTSAIASSARPGLEIFIACVNNNGGAATFATKQYSVAYCGAYLGSTKQAALYTAVQAYMTAIGKQV